MKSALSLALSAIVFLSAIPSSRAGTSTDIIVEYQTELTQSTVTKVKAQLDGIKNWQEFKKQVAQTFKPSSPVSADIHQTIRQNEARPFVPFETQGSDQTLSLRSGTLEAHVDLQTLTLHVRGQSLSFADKTPEEIYDFAAKAFSTEKKSSSFNLRALFISDAHAVVPLIAMVVVALIAMAANGLRYGLSSMNCDRRLSHFASYVTNKLMEDCAPKRNSEIESAPASIVEAVESRVLRPSPIPRFQRCAAELKASSMFTSSAYFGGTGRSCVTDEMARQICQDKVALDRCEEMRAGLRAAENNSERGHPGDRRATPASRNAPSPAGRRH